MTGAGTFNTGIKAEWQREKRDYEVISVEEITRRHQVLGARSVEDAESTIERDLAETTDTGSIISRVLISCEAIPVDELVEENEGDDDEMAY